MIDNENNKLILESIKLAVGTTSYFGVSISKIYQEVISKLRYYYSETKDAVYLEAACLHIQAYMEMGYEYDNNKELFDDILMRLGTCRDEKFPRKFYLSTKIKLTRQDVRRMILKWPPSKNRMSIGDVVDDIIYKVNNRIEGIHYYNSNPAPNSKKLIGGDLYELVINTEEMYFHDIKRRKYFTFLL